jgi:anti-sigma factor RsiW
MMGCPDRDILLHGYLDGELDAANTVAFEDHLRSCPGCARSLADYRALSSRLSRPAVGYRASPALEARVGGLLRASRPSHRRWRAAPWIASGGFAALAASLAVLMVQANVTQLESQLISGHVRSTLATHLVDVETSDRHTVKPWFNGRVPFAPPVVDLAEAGYPLVGGRLDVIDDQVVAALVYRRNRHVINVFVRPQASRIRPLGRAAARDGYAISYWRAQGLEFWAVSDIDPEDLAIFQKTFVARSPS